jgi:arginase family enzyme
VAGIGLIGVPSDSAGIAGGVALAPAALRRAGLVRALSGSVTVEELGDIELPSPTPGRDPATAIIDPGMLAAVVDGVAAATA